MFDSYCSPASPNSRKTASARRHRRTAIHLEVLDRRLAPSADVTGLWQGTLLQPTGGLQTSYSFVMDLVQDSGQVQGVSRIELDNTQPFGVMKLIGSVSESTFTSQEQTILYQDLPSGYVWYLKTDNLQVSADGSSMSGTWSGSAPGAPDGSGTITLSHASISTPSLTGSWQGSLTEPSGGSSTLFLLELDLVQNQDMVQGIEGIEQPGQGNYYADIKLTGIVIGDEFIFQETTITQQDPPPGYDWLIKSGNLQVSTSGNSMVGPWNSGSYEGTINLNLAPSSPTPTPTPTTPTPTPTTPRPTPTTPTPTPTAPPPSTSPGPAGPAPGFFHTKTSLKGRPRATASGRPVTLTARVKIVGHTRDLPTGLVRFLDGSTVLGTVSLTRGQAKLVTSSLAMGPNVVQVQYTGGPDFAPSNSGVVIENIKTARSEGS